MTQAELNIGWRGGMAPDGADLGRDRDGGIAFGDEYMLPAAAGSLRSRPLWYLRYHLPLQLCWWDNKTFTTALRASPKRQNRKKFFSPRSHKSRFFYYYSRRKQDYKALLKAGAFLPILGPAGRGISDKQGSPCFLLSNLAGKDKIT